jgi:hypothetical protein
MCILTIFLFLAGGLCALFGALGADVLGSVHLVPLAIALAAGGLATGHFHRHP